MKKEIWVEIQGFENYLISSFGNVFSKFSKKNLIKHKNTSGYLFVNLYKNKKGSPCMIHKLTFENFNNIKSNRNFVIDHINNIKTDNNLENLQLITNRENSTKNKINKSGFSCVYKNGKSWIVRTRVKGEKITIGTFKNLDFAVKKRDKFLKLINKDFEK